MILVALILIPLAGGLLAWLLGPRQTGLARWVSLAAMGIDLVIELGLWVQFFGSRLTLTSQPVWLVEASWPWIAGLGINIHVGLDGLSLLLILLTSLLGIMAVLASWTEVTERVGFFHFNLLWALAGITGVFLALDLFLFYFFWELMLVPMYFLIALWGHEQRLYAAVKFFLFTQAGGLFMLLAILGLRFVHAAATGVYTYDYSQLLGTVMPAGTAFWLMLGFAIAFAVKLPVVPVHTWLPDAHTEAPTAGSVILAGVLLKTGAYGLLRFVVPLFPLAAQAVAPAAMSLGVLGILYGALLAFAQRDLKRMIAYTSISHMGFVLLGVFAGNELALQGVMMQILCHGISAAALFILAGALQQRLHTRDLDQMGGLWANLPRMGTSALVFGLASLGLPGFGNFIGEFLVLLGTYPAHPWLASLAALGLIAATIYALWLIQRAFHGARRGEAEPGPLLDLSRREMSMMAVLFVVIMGLGLYPQPALDTMKQSLPALQTMPVPAQVLVTPPVEASSGVTSQGAQP
jgi:NADH-quinone oxidoreductase subunit M